MKKLFESELDCCGCEACVNVCSQSAISMAEDEYGFKYPQIDPAKCVDCGACFRKCDFKKTVKNGVESNTPTEAYAAYHKDDNILMESASGGVFTAFAEYVIKQGGCVYGCIMDDDFNVKIVRGDAIGDIKPMRGSKYLQSEIGEVYKDVKIQLQNNRLVLFTGTPCQVAALKSYLGSAPTDRLITIDLICHGVPSVKSFKLYVSFLEKHKNTVIKKYYFRSKKYGWGSGAIERVTEKNGIFSNNVVLGKDDFFKSNFSSWNSIRPSCSACKYANFSRVGDFTMGDYWGWERLGMSIPTKQGLSVFLVNTSKWTDIIYSLNLNLIRSPLDVARQGNETFNHPARRGRFWDEFMQCVANNDFLPFYEGFEKFRKTRNRKDKINRIKNVIKIPFRIIRKLFNQ